MRCAETKLKERQNQWTLTKVRLALHQECLLAVYQPTKSQPIPVCHSEEKHYEKVL
jgi:hypothetical protein